MDLCNRKTVQEIMGTFGIRFRKEFGQNFLTNQAVVADIADGCADDPETTILEIGPGIGTLSKELAERYRNVIALEIDRGLIPVLGFTMTGYPNFKVFNEDVMKADLAGLLQPYFDAGKVAVCANLPYYITTPILMKLLECGLPFESITIMIQAEVADRLCAKAGSKDCGAITAVLSYYGTAEKLFRVSAGNFVPPPKVDSTVVRIRLYPKDERPYRPQNEAILFRTIRAAFEQRRKTLPNALAAGFPELTKECLTEIVESCGHRPDIRGEKLDIAEFVALSDEIAKKLLAE